MKQTKITTTENYTDSQGVHTVCKGVLRLIETSFEDKRFHWIDKDFNSRFSKPIIISDEPIEVGDNYLSEINTILEAKDYNIDFIKQNPRLKKVIVLPEQFSPKHLQAIVNGKLKDGDKCLIKCIEDAEPGIRTHLGQPIIKFNKVYLNQSNHIKLFRTNQDNCNDIFQILNNPDVSIGTKEAMIRERYNSPTLKK